jgi:hypothetical protein
MLDRDGLSIVQRMVYPATVQKATEIDRMVMF